MDFGLAKLIDDPATHKVTDTNVDFAVGTPGYIAPEQVRGETMDHRGDLYSVGVMMYELLTGRLPFLGANGMDVLLAHATEAPPTFAEIGLPHWVPRAVEEVVFAVLEKSPDDRPQSARELSERLAEAIRCSEERSALRSVSRPTPAPMAPAPRDLPDDPEALIPLETDAEFRHRADTPTDLSGDGEPGDCTALHFRVEAWMPEVIAIRKLRGFVHDCAGEVLENAPGLVRVRLGQGRTPATTLAWFGLGRRSNGPIEIELRLTRADSRQENVLTIDVRFPASHPSLLSDAAWKGRCTKLYIELRAYLMGGGG